MVSGGGVVTVMLAIPNTVGTSVLVARIVTAPGVNAVTSPVALTCAIALSEDVHVKAVLAPTSASIVAKNCRVPLTTKEAVVGERATLRTVGAVTVSKVEPFTVGFAVLVARIVVVPGATAVTRPLLLMVATLVAVLVQFTEVGVPGSASTVAVIGRVAPCNMLGSAGVTTTLRTTGKLT